MVRAARAVRAVLSVPAVLSVRPAPVFPAPGWVDRGSAARGFMVRCFAVRGFAVRGSAVRDRFVRAPSRRVPRFAAPLVVPEPSPGFLSAVRFAAPRFSGVPFSVFSVVCFAVLRRISHPAMLITGNSLPPGAPSSPLHRCVSVFAACP
ncbi:hypothetical protein AB0B95_01340 [Streptomyces hygroscopicus]|uniref:hypothetical protein n=1 Tax=Streptomyces hygroscopicus TaxID=1912 RepID=UPI000767AED1|nr:hypothetical protein [Streptomyces hygroscopicus]